MRSVLSRKAFTLTELLITMGIFVLMLALAVPAFKLLSGSKSIEQGTNIVSSMLARTRNEAIGLQGYRALLFYRDPGTDRIGMIILQETPIQTITGVTWYNPYGMPMPVAGMAFDLAPDAEPLLLPPGIGMQAIVPFNTTGGVKSGNGYVGFNTSALGNDVAMGPLFVFSPEGRLSLDSAGLYIRDLGGAKTTLGQLLFRNVNPGYTYATNFMAQVGFCVFEHEPFVALSHLNTLASTYEDDPNVPGRRSRRGNLAGRELDSLPY